MSAPLEPGSQQGKRALPLIGKLPGNRSKRPQQLVTAAS